MQAQIFTLYYFKIWIKKTLTLNIILCNMFLYLQVLINKKTSTKTKKNTSCNTVTDLQKVGVEFKFMRVLSIFCFIQSINNYEQINTYWSYIV